MPPSSIPGSHASSYSLRMSVGANARSAYDACRFSSHEQHERRRSAGSSPMLLVSAVSVPITSAEPGVAAIRMPCSMVTACPDSGNVAGSVMRSVSGARML